MQNESGENVDLYIPRKCSASNRIIHAKDYASIQLNVAEVDEATGRYTGNNIRYAICGDIRRMGESDDCISRLGKRDGFLPKWFGHFKSAQQRTNPCFITYSLYSGTMCTQPKYVPEGHLLMVQELLK